MVHRSDDRLRSIDRVHAASRSREHEPSLDRYFFQRIRPLMEQALRENRRETWPLITLNLDFKTTEMDHLRAVWELLGRYESWLTTARRGKGNEVSDLVAGPLLVLTGDADEQEHVFHDSVPSGAVLRVFGAVHSRLGQAAGSPGETRVRAGRELPDVSPGPCVRTTDAGGITPGASSNYVVR